MRGLVNINTLSPNNKYYYRIKKPSSVGMATFRTELAFYNIDKELIYHRNNAIVLPQPFSTLEFVIWSRQGNVAFFVEKNNHSKIFETVFLDLANERSYRLDIAMAEHDTLLESMKLVDRLFDENLLANTLAAHKIPSTQFYTDTIIKPTIAKSIFTDTNWYPKV